MPLDISKIANSVIKNEVRIGALEQVVEKLAQGRSVSPQDFQNFVERSKNDVKNKYPEADLQDSQ